MRYERLQERSRGASASKKRRGSKGNSRVRRVLATYRAGGEENQLLRVRGFVFGVVLGSRTTVYDEMVRRLRTSKGERGVAPFYRVYEEGVGGVAILVPMVCLGSVIVGRDTSLCGKEVKGEGDLTLLGRQTRSIRGALGAYASRGVFPTA